MDPMTLKQLGEWRLDDLRREASLRNTAGASARDRRPLRAARRHSGAVLIRIGLRIMGSDATAALDRA
jgi:hypothetical protein